MYGGGNSSRKRKTVSLRRRLFRCLWQVFGLLPFRCSHRSLRLPVSLVPSLWTAIFLIVDTSVSYRIFACSPELPLAFRCLYELHNFLSHLSSVTIFCKCIFTEFREVESVYNFVIRSKKNRYAPEKHSRIWYLALDVLFSLQILMGISHLYTTWKLKKLPCIGMGTVVRLLLNLTTVVILSQFVYMMEGIDQAFRDMKKHLIERILTPLSSLPRRGTAIFQVETTGIPTVFSQAATLSAVSSGYSTLLRILLILEAHFGIVIAIDMASTFFALLFGVNNLLQIYIEYTRTSELSDTGVHFMMRSLAIMVYGLLRLALVIEVCHAVIMHAEGIRWVLRIEGKEVPAIRFSAASYFTVDRRLFVSVISVTVTYAIILWQLRV